MTKQKLATTNKLVITYNNGKVYTIPRVKHFILSDDGKSVTGEYSKQVTVDTMTEHHTIKFTLQLMDVVHLDYRAKHGETSFFRGVDKGVITSKTEIRDEDYYERMNKVVCVNTGITPFFDKSIILDSVISKPNPLAISKYF